MLMKILLTLGSETRISNGFLTGSGVAPLQRSYQCYAFPMPQKAHVPSDIKEVGGVPAVKSKDIHSRHSKASAVHEAPNAAIELDEVEVVLLRLDL